MKVKKESEKVGLKLNIQKTKIMASGPITSWQVDGETVETVAEFIFLGSKITADGDCRHEIKRSLLLGRKTMTNLESILRSRDITWLTNVPLVKAMVFPVVMYGCESWTIKKAERWKIAAFELWCWRRLLRVAWTTRRLSQLILRKSVLNIDWKDWCWSWNPNTLAIWCEELTHWKRPWCCERLRAGGEGDDRRWDGWMVSSTQWTWIWVDSGSWWWKGRPDMLWFMGCKESDMTEQLNWTDWMDIILRIKFKMIWIARRKDWGEWKNKCENWRALFHRTIFFLSLLFLLPLSPCISVFFLLQIDTWEEGCDDLLDTWFPSSVNFPKEKTSGMTSLAPTELPALFENTGL